MSGNKNFLFTDTTKTLVLGTHKVFVQILKDTEEKIKTDQQKTDQELRSQAIFELEQDPNSDYNKYRQELSVKLPELQETLKQRQQELSTSPHKSAAIINQIQSIQDKIEDIIAKPEQQINDYIKQIKSRSLIDVLYHNTRTAPESSNISSKYNMPVNAFAVSRIQKLYKISNKLKKTGISQKAIDDFVKEILQQDFNKQALTNINTTNQTYAKNLEEFFDSVNNLEKIAIEKALQALKTKYPANILDPLITHTTQLLTIANKADILGKLTQQLAESEANLISLSRSLQQQQIQNTKIIIDLRIQHELLIKQLTDAEGDSHSKEQKIAAITSQLTDIQIKLTTVEKENNELKEQEQKNKQSITDLQTQLTSLQADLSAKTKEIDNYKKTIAANDTSIATLKQQLQTSNHNQQQNQEQLDKKLTENSKLKQELHTAETALFKEQQAHITTSSLLTTTKQQLESTSSALKAAEENLLKIQKERQEQDEQTKKITSELEQAAQAQINDLKQQQAVLNDRTTKLETANTGLQAQLTSAQEETIRLNKELQINQDKLAKALNDNQTLKLEQEKLTTQLKQAKQSDSENTIKLKQELATINDQLEQNIKEVSTLRQETARLANENAALNIENVSLKSANQELSEQLIDAKKQQAELANKIADQDATIQDKTAQIESINAIIAKQKHSITELTEEKQKVLLEIDRLKSSNTLNASEITKLQTIIEQKDQAIATANTSIDQLTNDLIIAKQTVANQEEIIKKLTTNITNSEASLAEKQALIDKLQTSAAEQENKYKLAKAQIETYESLIEQKIQDFTKTENALKSSLTDTKQMLSKTNNQLKQANRDKQDLSNQLSTAKQEALELNQKTSQQIQDLNKQLAVKQLENANLTKQLENNQKEIEELEHKTAEQEQEITKHKELIKKLRKELQESAGSKKQAFDLFQLKKAQDLRIQQLEAAHENLLQDLKFNKIALHTKNVLINSLKQQLNKLQLELTQKDHEISELTRELDSFKEKYKEANDSIKQLQRQLEQETLARQQLEQELLALESTKSSHVAANNQEILQKQEELAEKNQIINDLTTELDTTYKKLTKALSDLDEARAEINRLNQELLETKQENAKLKEELAAAHKREEAAVLKYQQELQARMQAEDKANTLETINQQLSMTTEQLKDLAKTSRPINEGTVQYTGEYLACFEAVKKLHLDAMRMKQQQYTGKLTDKDKLSIRSRVMSLGGTEQQVNNLFKYLENPTELNVSRITRIMLSLNQQTSNQQSLESLKKLLQKKIESFQQTTIQEPEPIKHEINLNSLVTFLGGNEKMVKTISDYLEAPNELKLSRVNRIMQALKPAINIEDQPKQQSFAELENLLLDKSAKTTKQTSNNNKPSGFSL